MLKLDVYELISFVKVRIQYEFIIVSELTYIMKYGIWPRIFQTLFMKYLCGFVQHFKSLHYVLFELWTPEDGSINYGFAQF